MKIKNYTHFTNILCAGVANMQLINTDNKGFRFLLCFTDILKDKKLQLTTISYVFQTILDKSNRKPKKKISEIIIAKL